MRHKKSDPKSEQKPLTPDEYRREVEIMSMYIDNARNYVKLGTGALALSIAFMRDVMGLQSNGPMSFNGFSGTFLIASWLLFLLAVCFGAFYQFLAVRYLESVSGLPDADLPVRYWLRRPIESPGGFYDAMMWLFHGAAVAFTVSAINRLLSLWPSHSS